MRIDDRAVRPDPATLRVRLRLETHLRRLRIGSLRIRRGVREDAWRSLVEDLSHMLQSGQSGLIRRPQGLGNHLDVRPARPEQRTSDRDARAAAALHAVYAAVQAVLRDPLRTPPADVRWLKRALQQLVDQVSTNETALLLRRGLELHRGGLVEHSVQVGLLTMTMGQQLQLDRQALLELGLCGVLHDIGKQRLAPEIVEKRGALTEAEWVEMKRHPREGLVALQAVLHPLRDRWRPMLAAYEHHMKIDQTGYPLVRRPRKIGLVSRIVSVADVYDAITSPRSYRARPWRPELVLRNMLDQPRWGLDRSLVKVLIQAIGLYPVGSLVQLEDGRTALVVSTPPDAPHAPLVRIVAAANGAAWPHFEELDLTDAGTPRVLHTLDPRERHVDMVGLLAETCATAV